MVMFYWFLIPVSMEKTEYEYHQLVELKLMTYLLECEFSRWLNASLTKIACLLINCCLSLSWQTTQ